MKYAFGAWLLMSISLACSSTGDGEDKLTQYTLRLSPTIENPKPLPNQTNIYVDWRYESGQQKSVLGFRGWDFDKDSRFEMVEVLDADGKTQAVLSDFDGDGVLDARTQGWTPSIKEKTTPPKSGGPKVIRSYQPKPVELIEGD